MKSHLFEETLPTGGMWSMRLPRFRRLRLTALTSGGNVSALMYHAHHPLDRLNVPDTLKALHTAKLTRGHVLMSDMGHAMASVVEDSLGWHDPIGGHSTPEHIEAAFGKKSYQEVRNACFRNARENFLIELSKHGLGLRDVVANVNFFSKVACDDAGRLSWVPDHCPAGATVELRMEMDVLVVLTNCPHPMHHGGSYPDSPVRMEVGEGDLPDDDDYCYGFRPECRRAVELSKRLFL